MQPDNPDYAYNLAVALEHIGQPKVALDYYRRALQLATAKGRANFSLTSAEERIGKLEKPSASLPAPRRATDHPAGIPFGVTPGQR